MKSFFQNYFIPYSTHCWGNQLPCRTNQTVSGLSYILLPLLFALEHLWHGQGEVPEGICANIWGTRSLELSESLPPNQCRDRSRWINILYPLGSMYAVHSTRFLWREVAELSWSCPQWWPAQLCTLDRLFFILCFPLQNPSSVPWDHFSRINSLEPIVQALLFLQELEVGGT